MSDKIKGFATLLGNPILASVESETAEEIVVSGALMVAAQQSEQGVRISFVPVCIFSDAEDLNKGVNIALRKSSIIYSFNVKDDLKQAYCKQVGTIITPDKKIQIAL